MFFDVTCSTCINRRADLAMIWTSKALFFRLNESFSALTLIVCAQDPILGTFLTFLCSACEASYKRRRARRASCTVEKESILTHLTPVCSAFFAVIHTRLAFVCRLIKVKGVDAAWTLRWRDKARIARGFTSDALHLCIEIYLTLATDSTKHNLLGRRVNDSQWTSRFRQSDSLQIT